MCIRVTGRRCRIGALHERFPDSEIVNFAVDLSAVFDLTANCEAMRSSGLLLIFAIFILFAGSFASAAAAKGGGNGELRVTVTVVSSVGIIIGPNGEQRVVVANAPELQREFEAMFLNADTPQTTAAKTHFVKTHFVKTHFIKPRDPRLANKLSRRHP